MPSQNLRRAIKVTSLTALGLSIPMIFLIYVHMFYKADDGSVGRLVQPFVLYNEEQQSITRHQLLNTLTLIALIPDRPLEEAELKSYADDLTTLTQKVKEQLSYHLHKGTANQKAKLQFLAIGSKLPLPSEWQFFHGDADVYLDLTGQPKSSELFLAIVDGEAQIVGVTSDISQESLFPILSKTSFKNYMSDYLQKRTFFGVKKPST